MAMTKFERRLLHNKGQKGGHKVGIANPNDLREGDTMVVKAAGGVLVQYFKMNGVVHKKTLDK